MAVVVNNPDKASDSSAAGWFVAAVVVVAVILGFIYLLPYLRSAASSGSANINVTIPNTGEEQKDLNIPSVQSPNNGVQPNMKVE